MQAPLYLSASQVTVLYGVGIAIRISRRDHNWYYRVATGVGSGSEDWVACGNRSYNRRQ